MKTSIAKGIFLSGLTAALLISGCGKKGDDGGAQSPVKPVDPKVEDSGNGQSPSGNGQAPGGTNRQDSGLTFAGDIGPTVAKKCAPCHNDGATSPAIVGHEDAFISNADQIAASITTTDPTKLMPKKVQGKILSDIEKEVLLGYLGRLTTPVRVLLSFEQDVNPILRAKCAPCHNDGNRAPYIIGHEEAYVQAGEAIAVSITTTDRAKMMPKQPEQKVLTDEEKAKILKFLGK